MKKILPFIVGIVFIGVGVFMFIKNENLVKKCTVEVEATVVDMREEFSADSDGSSYIYYPILEYRTSENNLRVKMDYGYSHPKYSVGDKVTILYNPQKESEFIIKGERASSVFSIVFTILGLLITGLGTVGLLKK